VKQLKKFQRNQVGTLNLIIGILFFLLATFKFINSIQDKDTFWMLFIESIPFYILGILCIKFDNKFVLSGVFLSVAIYSILTSNSIDDYSGSIFILFSFHSIKNKKIIIPYSLLTIITISINSAIHELRFNTAFNILIAYFAVYTIYYFLIYKDLSLTKNIDNLSKEERDILFLYLKGYNYEEISKTLKLNVLPTTIRRKIKAIKEHNNIKNDVQFGKWLFNLV